jgi:uncharacterized protein YkwD
MALAGGLGCSSSSSDLTPEGGSGGSSSSVSTGSTAGSTTSSGHGGAGASSTTATTGIGSAVASGTSSSTSNQASTAQSSSSTGEGAGGSSSTAASGGGGSSDFDQFQQRNLADVNQYRATLNIAPLVLDQTLSAFALAGSQELTMDHMPHQHFKNAGNALWTEGFTSQAAENQGDPNGWNTLAADPVQNELDQIDQIQNAMFDEGPGTGEAHGHYENIMNPKLTRLGVGLIEVGTSLYLTNDFSD